MWRAWEDVCLYEYNELAGWIRSVRNGTWKPFRIRPSIDHEAILAGQVRRYRHVVNGYIMPINGCGS